MEEVSVVRLTAETDVRAALSLARRVFDRFVVPLCQPEARPAFYARTDWDSSRPGFESGADVYYGAYAGNVLAGVAAVRNGERMLLLFVDEAYQHRGVARALLARLLAEASGDVISVSASPYAHLAYERMGFRRLGPPETAEGMTHYPMEYRKR